MCCGLQDWPGDDEKNEVEFRYFCGNTDHSGAMEEAGVLEADAIIIGPADDLSDNEVRLFAPSIPVVSRLESVCSCVCYYVWPLWSVFKVASALTLPLAQSSRWGG